MKSFNKAFLLVFVTSLIVACGSKKNEGQNESAATYYNQFITASKGVKNGKVLISPELGNIQGLSCNGNGNFSGNNNYQAQLRLEVDSMGSFSIMAQTPGAQFLDDSIARAAVNGIWTMQDFTSRFDGVGMVNPDNSTNIASPSFGLAFSQQNCGAWTQGIQSYCGNLPGFFLTIDQNLSLEVLDPSYNSNNNFFGNSGQIDLPVDSVIPFCLQDAL